MHTTNQTTTTIVSPPQDAKNAVISSSGDPALIPVKPLQQSIPVGKTIRLKEAGYDEYWLQDRIFENPQILGPGELEAVTRERQQSSGGKLDVLLKDPEDNGMYEVEVMLGQTDESHIIRAIEYWDIEKRK